VRSTSPTLPLILFAAGIAPLTGRALWLHDVLALPRRCPLPVVVVESPDGVGAAASAAASAGASEVWAALPAGHSDLGAATPDPNILREGADGRIRVADWPSLRGTLPLAEALDDLVVVQANQLGRDTLAGQIVVATSNDIAHGVGVAVPGRVAPVDRGHVLAVAIGARKAELLLKVIPAPLAGLATAWLAWLSAAALRRRMPLAGLRLWFLASAVALVVAGLARQVGWDLPIGGALLALAATTHRLASASALAINAVDRLTLRLGAPATDQATDRTEPDLAALFALYAPGWALTAWDRSRKLQPVMRLQVGPTDQMPTLVQLPLDRERHGPALVVPIVEGGATVGAFAIVGPEQPSETLIDVLHSLVFRNPLGAAPPSTRDIDPFQGRLELARATAAKALARSEQWEAILGESAVPIGYFGLRGELVSAGRRLREYIPRGDNIPLIGFLQRVAGISRDRAEEAVRLALQAPTVVELSEREGGREMVIFPVREGKAHHGFLVTFQDPGPHRALDQLKTSTLQTVGFHLRNQLLSIMGLAAQVAEEEDPARRSTMADAIEAAAISAAEMLNRLDEIARSGLGDTPTQPLDCGRAVHDAIERLSPERQARVTSRIPTIAAPVAARGDLLDAALDQLLDDVTRDGGRVVVSLTTTEQGMRLDVSDDGGGLPIAMVDRRRGDSESHGPEVALRRAVDAVGGTLHQSSVPGSGNRTTLTLPYF
jgi:signal transduction histidine kinase